MQDRVDTDSRLIKNNIPYIKNIFLNLLKFHLDEELHIKADASGDVAIYLSYNGEDFKIVYNDYKDLYELYHFNRRNNNGLAIHYHKQFESYSLVLCIKRLGTCHSPKDINEKLKTKTDKLFDKIKNPPKFTVK